MFLSILGITALGVLGYNSLKDEESRIKTKAILARTIEHTEKNMNKKFKNGELGSEKAEEFLDFEEKFNKNHDNFIQWKIDAEMLKFKKDTGYTEESIKFNKNHDNFIQWKIDAEMLKFKKDTGYTEESIKYQQKLEDLQHKYFKY